MRRRAGVVDVGRCLQQMGAKIDGLGTRTVRITGVGQLSGADHKVSRDRIEAGAYALAVAASGESVDLTGITGEELGALLPALRLADVQVAENDTGTQPACGFPPRKVDPMPHLSPPNLFPALPPTYRPLYGAYVPRQWRQSHSRNDFENRFMRAGTGAAGCRYFAGRRHGHCHRG